MLTDHIISNIKIEIANEVGTSVANVEQVLDKYYKAVAKAKKNGEPKIKLDYLGSFRIKDKKLKDAGLSNTGG